MSDEIKNKIEAILFASGSKISIEELSKLTGLSQKIITTTLSQLKEEYEQKTHSLKILDEGEMWKMSVKEKYMPLVRSVVTETELQKSVLETLAVIAWKAPILQSDIIKLRNNKAYEHIGELMNSGFINKEREGRSYKIKLATKFFDYFDIENVKKLRNSGGLSHQTVFWFSAAGMRRPTKCLLKSIWGPMTFSYTQTYTERLQLSS